MQKTIANPIIIHGIGVHTGNQVKMVMLPASENTGIVFERTDITSGNNIIEASRPFNVCETNLGTTICNSDKVVIATIEHLMAALWALKINNVRIQLNSQEIPIGDGSSRLFIEEIMKVGVIEQNAPEKVIIVKKPVSVTIKDSTITLTPSDRFIVDATIDFPCQVIGKQTAKFDSANNSFTKDFADARTFGYISDLNKLNQMGLALGASLDNAIGIDNGQVMNPGGLRHIDEFIRHKILDLIGDFLVAGYRMQAHVKAYKPGHGVNNAILRELLSSSSNYEIIEVNPFKDNYIFQNVVGLYTPLSRASNS